jgi:spore photoproduct lyase
MIIYLESHIRNHPCALRILSKFPGIPVIEIAHYKNIFDKSIGNCSTEKCLILAKLEGDHISACPPGYDRYDHSFFFKNSIGCVFDCAYCYLKGAFKNRFPVIFVNFEDIQDEIERKISLVREQDPTGSIMFYSSDYSDVLALDEIMGFTQSFIPFFEKFSGVACEIRTKSANIQSLLSLPSVPKNTEIAFSLNPDTIIARYEHGAPSLQARIDALTALLAKGFRVGLRFLPLLPVPDFVSVYEDFLVQITRTIPLDRIVSISVGALLFTSDDYKNMLRKYGDLDCLYHIDPVSDDAFVRLSKDIRTQFYDLFSKYLKGYSVCLDQLGE